EVLQRHYTPMRIAVVILAAMFSIGNVSQTFSYRSAWRDGESLWQYHVALSHPAPEAFGNLAAYYYSVASEHRNTPEGDKAIRKMAIVIDAGLDEFWPERKGPPPAKTWQLFFLRSIEQQVDGRLEDALANLRLADQLRPGFDSV